ncbi:MAG: helix-turn-helix transcriptional regulator [Pseudomonadota bacterium]
MLPAVAIVLVQGFACVFFVADALSEETGTVSSRSGNALEVGVALALLAGTLLGAAYLYHLVREMRVRAHVVAIATGALSQIIADRFVDWKLSAAESDVAMFALKGLSIAEIAAFRSAATGTVRAQLSQVYAKAGVSSQSMLMFLDDLLAHDGVEVPKAAGDASRSVLSSRR